MKGLKGFDPTDNPNDLVVLVAIIGWGILFVFLIDAALDWLTTLTWFVK